MAKTEKKSETVTVRARTARISLNFNCSKTDEDFVIVESIRRYPKNYNYSQYRPFTSVWDEILQKEKIDDVCIGNLRRNGRDEKNTNNDEVVERLFMLFKRGGGMSRMLDKEGFKKAMQFASPESDNPNDPKETVAKKAEAIEMEDLAELLLCALPHVVFGSGNGERLTNIGGKLLSLNTESDTSCTAFETNIDKVNDIEKIGDKEYKHRLKLNLATYRTVEDVQRELDLCGDSHSKKKRKKSLERALRGPRYVKFPHFLSRSCQDRREDEKQVEYVKCGIYREKANAPLVACSTCEALWESKHFHYDEILRLARKYLGNYMTISFLEQDVQRLSNTKVRKHIKSLDNMMQGLEISFIDAFDREFLRRSNDNDNDAENAGKRYNETVLNFEQCLENVVKAIEKLIKKDVSKIENDSPVPEEVSGNPSLVIRLVADEDMYTCRNVEDVYLQDCGNAVVQHVSEKVIRKVGKKNADAVAKNILKELLVKRDIVNGIITVDKWADYGFDRDICFGTLREKEQDENDKKKKKEYDGYHYIRISPDGRCRYGTVGAIPGGINGNDRKRVECFFWFPEELPESNTDIYSLTEQNREKICVIENTEEHYLPLMEAREVQKIIERSSDKVKLKTSDGNIVDRWSVCERWVRGVVNKLPDSEAKKLLEAACDRYAKNAKIEEMDSPEPIDSEAFKKLRKELVFSTRNLYKWLKRMNVPSTTNSGETLIEEAIRLSSIPFERGRGKVLDEAKKILEKHCDVEFVHSKSEIALNTTFGGLLNTTYRVETNHLGDVELYYAVGRANEDIKGTEHKVEQTSLIRQITVGSESAMGERELVEKILPMLHVSFVRLNMPTAVPYPVKLLREHVLALSAEEQRRNKSTIAAGEMEP